MERGLVILFACGFLLGSFTGCLAMVLCAVADDVVYDNDDNDDVVYDNDDNDEEEC